MFPLLYALKRVLTVVVVVVVVSVLLFYTLNTLLPFTILYTTVLSNASSAPFHPFSDLPERKRRTHIHTNNFFN